MDHLNQRKIPAFTGSGFKFLQQKIPSLSSSGQHQLASLLPDLPADSDTQLTKSPPQMLYDSSMTEQQLLDMAFHNQISFFTTICRVFDDNPTGPVAAKHIIRTCALAIPPHKAPACMDAREIVLAALHFLSCDQVQLLRAVNDDITDLEKRNYQKAKPWTLDQIQNQLNNYEYVFFDTPTYQFLSRGRFLPRHLTLNETEQRQLLVRGNARQGSTKDSTTSPGKSRKKPKTVAVDALAAPPVVSAADAAPKGVLDVTTSDETARLPNDTL